VRTPASEADLAVSPDDGIEIVDDLAFDELPIDEEVPSPAEGARSANDPSGAARGDPFTTFVRLLEAVAYASGARPEVGAAIAGLFGQVRLDAGGLPQATIDALAEGGHIEPSARGAIRSAVLSATVGAWQDVLRGESGDLAACGVAMLDEWAADVLARLLGEPCRAESIRRELRRRGVAAFGLVAHAA
jgi:hypothetical protein